MKSCRPSSGLETRATEALQALLERISGVKLKQIDRDPSHRGRAFDLLAHIEVYGHSHTLACKVKVFSTSRQISLALSQMHAHAACLAGNATPVFISPSLSSEAQELCKQARASFLDLEGNARLVLGETFIGLRSHRCCDANHPSAPSPRPDSRFVDADNLRHFPADDADVALIA